MPPFRSIVWLLGALLSFPPAAYSRDANSIEDFGSLSSHMSRIPSSLLIPFHSWFPDRRWKGIEAQKNRILYIVGGWMMYTWPCGAYNGPSWYPHCNLLLSISRIRKGTLEILIG